MVSNRLTDKREIIIILYVVLIIRRQLNKRRVFAIVKVVLLFNALLRLLRLN